MIGRPAVRVLPHHQVRLGDGSIALLGRSARRWAVVPSEMAALLPAAPDAVVRSSAAWLDDLVDAGICARDDAHPLTNRPASACRSERPPPSLLIKVTGACNIACTYCYDYHEERWHGALDLDLVCAAIDSMLANSDRLALIFHGGEPLLAFGKIRAIVAHCEAIAADRPVAISYALQSNGLLLTDEIVAFLLSHAFDVGISLDGPAWINDASRVDHKGRATHRRFMAIMERYPDFLRDRVGYLAVVDPGSPTDLRAVLDFFAELGVATLKLMPQHDGGKAHTDPDRTFEPFLDLLADELERIGSGYGGRPYLTNLIELIDRFLIERENNVCMADGCGAGREFLVIDAKNHVRACDITYDATFHLAPPRADGDLIDQARRSTNAQRLQDRHRRLRQAGACSSCAWLSFCGGSCPGKALMHGGSIDGVDEIECRTRLRLFPRILEMLVQQDSALLAYYRARIASRSHTRRT